MIGTVDSHGRALVDLAVCNSPDSETNSVTAWIDTALDGHLVFPLRIIQQLQLETLAETEAVLADGTKVTLDTFLCYVTGSPNVSRCK